MGTRRNYQRSSNKNESPLHVLPVADKLIDYTLDLTDNANRFPKKVRFSRERPVTPNAGNANNARNVNTDGSLNNNNAYNGNNGVRPDLVENVTE